MPEPWGSLPPGSLVPCIRAQGDIKQANNSLLLRPGDLSGPPVPGGASRSKRRASPKLVSHRAVQGSLRDEACSPCGPKASLQAAETGSPAALRARTLPAGCPPTHGNGGRRPGSRQMLFLLPQSLLRTGRQLGDTETRLPCLLLASRFAG